MSVAEPSGRLAAYQRLSRYLFPRGYMGKIFLLTFVAANIPLITLLGYLVLVSDHSDREVRETLLVGLAATLVGTGVALSGLWILLAPVTIASQTLDEYRKIGARSSLPVNLNGEGGRLLADVHDTLTHLDTVVAELEESATRDDLTGVFNRREGERRIREDLAAWGAADWRLALVVLDADGLKAINDQFGHMAGDLCIRHLATAIVGRIRNDGWVARWGGDEFVVVLREAEGASSADSVVEAITQDLAESSVLLPSGDQTAVVLSAGIAWAVPDDNAMTLLERADAALYEAKRNRPTHIDCPSDRA